MVTKALTGAAGDVSERPRDSLLVRLAPGLALAAVLLLVGFLNFYRLTELGYANQYYAAAVRSMMQNWHAFFFASFDAAGFVTVDKPPVGLWVQTLSAKVFGFHGFTILLPQALAGVGSVAVLYGLVRRTFGTVAGLLAALMLALTPIAVATNRNNTMDSVLLFVLLLGAWAVLRASETGRLRWLVLSAALVGVGFNIKMLQAYLVVPAFFLVYLAAAPLRWWKRLVHLALASVVLVAVSLSWAVAVDLTPADQRPYVGGSSNNSVIDLIVGYNGLNRLLPERFGTFGGRARSGDVGAQRSPVTAPPPSGPGVQPPAPFGGRPSTPFAGETGARGPLRLFNEQLAGQISWLLPLALFGFVAAWRWLPRAALDRRHQSLLLWGGWLLTAGAFFSVAGFFHRYYLIMLGPPIAALAGIGIVAMWDAYRRPGPRGWLLPLALLVTAAVQVSILASYPAWSDRLAWPIAAVCLLAALLLVAARIVPRLAGWLRPAVALAAAVAALLVAPAAWAAVTVRDGGGGGLPAAGPATAGPFGRMGGPPPGGRGGPGGPGRTADPALISFLQANRGDARFLVATQSTMDAAPIILATGEPVMALGGFSGGDPILTADRLAQLVADGAVRFFLFLLPNLSGGQAAPPAFTDAPAGGPLGPPMGQGDARPPFPAPPGGQAGYGPAMTMPIGAMIGGPGGRQADIIRWVSEQCTPVPAEAWQGASAAAARPALAVAGFLVPVRPQLYDCGTAGR